MRPEQADGERAGGERELEGVRMLRLLQLADSAFPAGAYAFSDGLETLVQRGEVRSAEELHALLQGQLQGGWGRCDPPACALAWDGSGGSTGDDTAAGTAVGELDELLDLLRPVPGPRQASLRVGHNLQRAALKLWPERLSGLEPARHQATVFGQLCRRLDIGRRDSVTAFVSGWLLGRAGQATRLMRLGGLEAQRVVSRLEEDAAACVERALQTGPGELCSFSPALDVAAAEQPGLEVRLFQS